MTTPNQEPTLDKVLRIATDLHWMARRYVDGRQSYATSLFNTHTRDLIALGANLNTTTDGTVWARDAGGRPFDHLTDEEAALGNPPDSWHEWLERRAEEAEAELARLREAFENPLLTGIDIHNGWVDMGIKGGAAQILAGAFAEQFKATGAVNYLECQFQAPDPEIGALIVTLQKCTGKTPGQLQQEAEVERDRLREEVVNLTVDAQMWTRLIEAMNDGQVSVILENHPDRAETIDGGIIVTQIDEVIEHICRQET